MKLRFLGTSAAEGVPAVFCNCDTCKRAKLAGGKDVRTRSQILIDDDTLFDFPMDTYMHMLKYSLDLSAVKRVLITHAHMDHCYPQEFCMHGGPFAVGMTQPVVTLYCNRTVRDIFDADTSREMRPAVRASIDVKTLSPFDRVQDGDVEIVALPAAHTAGEDCLVYYVGRGGKGVLLLNDTGVLDESVFARLADMGCRADCVTFDCTYGVVRHGPGRHMGLLDGIDQLELMIKTGVLRPDAVKIATHFSHNNPLDHQAMQAQANKYSVVVAYDGLTVTL